MKSGIRTFIAALCLGVYLASGSALWAQADVEKHKACGYCGMNRGQFAHSRMLFTYEDGTEAGLCSLHCAAIELVVNLDKTLKLVQVADYNTKKLIEAEKAVWVIGGSKPGVMTKRGKWAFENIAGARMFMKDHGGSLAAYEEAIKAAFEDMYEDTKMIRERRKLKRIDQNKGGKPIAGGS